MTQVTLNKKLGGNDRGATINVTPSTAAYLINTGHADPTTSEPDKINEQPAGNASVDAWRDYALTQGHTEEELDGLKRDDIKALLVG